MQVRVLYFGVLKDVLSSNGDVVALPEGATVAGLMELLRNRNGIDDRAEGAAHPVWSALAVAVNHEYATASAVLHDGDEVALLPHETGGSSEIGRAHV